MFEAWIAEIEGAYPIGSLFMFDVDPVLVADWRGFFDVGGGCFFTFWGVFADCADWSSWGTTFSIGGRGGACSVVLVFSPLKLSSVVSSVTVRSPPTLSVFSYTLTRGFGTAASAFSIGLPFSGALPNAGVISPTSTYLTVSSGFASTILLLSLSDLYTASFRVTASSLLSYSWDLLVDSVELKLIFVVFLTVVCFLLLRWV